VLSVERLNPEIYQSWMGGLSPDRCCWCLPSVHPREASLELLGADLGAGPDVGEEKLKRFFLADAFDWCETMRPEMVRTWVLTNGHSLPHCRTNDVLSNFPEFREAFGCTPTQPMVRQNACRVW
jgi:peptidase M13-like protein